MQKAEMVWSWDHVLQGFCTDVFYHLTFLLYFFCLNTCKFIPVAWINEGNQWSCFLPLAAIKGFAFPEHLCSLSCWDASYDDAFWGCHIKCCITKPKQGFSLGHGSAAISIRASANLFNLVEKQTLLVPHLPLLISLLENKPWHLISLSEAECYY